jgi:hypothetical protein
MPKSSESLHLSFCAFTIHVCCILIDCVFAIRWFCSRVIAVRGISRHSIRGLQSIHLWAMRQVTLNILRLYYFLYLFCRIRTAWHQGLFCAPMLGLTRIELSSLENHRSIRVVIIGLQLLSLACPGLGLGSCYVHHLWLCHSIIVMVILSY